MRIEDSILRSALEKLIDVKMNKTELAEKAGIARSTIAKMGKNEIVSLDVIVKICDALDCDIVDVVRVLPTENS